MSTALIPEAAQETRKPKPKPPTPRDMLIKRVHRDAGFGNVETQQFVKWLDMLGRMISPRESFTYELSPHDMSTKHPILERLIPDDTESAAGSIHRDIERYLGGDRGIVTITHSKTGDGKAVYCTVRIELCAVWIDD